MSDTKSYVPMNYKYLQQEGTMLGIQMITCRPKKTKEPTHPQYNTVGLFQRLRLLSHYSLSHYLDIIPAKHNETFVLSETYQNNFENCVEKVDSLNKMRMIQDIVEATQYLHEHDIIVGYFNPKNIYVTNTGIVKLGNYALYYLSEGNKYFDAYTHIPTLSPETILLSTHECTFESDVFSIGLLYLYLTLKCIPSKTKYIHFMKLLKDLYDVHCPTCEKCKLFSCQEFSSMLLQLISTQFSTQVVLPEIIVACLSSPETRPTTKTLLSNQIFSALRPDVQPISNERLELLNFSYNAPKCYMTLREILHEMCYFKTLSIDVSKKYVDIIGETFGVMKKYPIFDIETYIPITTDLTTQEVKNDFSIYSIDVTDVVNYSFDVDEELGRLDSSEALRGAPDKQPQFVTFLTQQITSLSESFNPQSANQQEVIRHHRLYHAYFRYFARYSVNDPRAAMNMLHKVKRIAQSFVPEFLRLPVWMLLLGIDINESYTLYAERSKDVPLVLTNKDITENTRVIVEDVNRAFSTVPLIANEITRNQLKRVLYSFLQSGEEYCQGIHSVCAVFISLSFNEAICSECLHRFEADYVRQYSPEKFRIYFTRFCQLLAFYGPKVAPKMSFIKIENSTAIRWFLPLLSLSMKMSSIYQLWDWIMQNQKSAKFMFFLIAFVLSCESTILTFSDPFDLILYFNKVEFDSSEVIEQCKSQFQNLISISPLSYTENVISPTHPARSEIYASLANNAIDEGNMCVVPFLDKSDLQNTLYKSSSLYIDMRPENTNPKTITVNSLRVTFTKEEDVVNEVSNSLRSLFQSYPPFVVLISDWNENDVQNTTSVYKNMMVVANGLVKNEFIHVCMSAVPFHSLESMFFTTNTNSAVRVDHDVDNQEVV
ncbi:hypothetical protein EIN_390780 [Entamoeba invadens IP1]|uniref:Rab-GAP TBC domain-containing protein n=1 Tax=Entamoeba invadens IP1 TaxID=370355 RepID=A0A0A1U8P2_ENTIV|nr:hypothetical protein EIN_390780 [Entamoeba invadens IP1]ELP89453.1 hypothetical protein EIN_390780 [Entamoeba invadens IP1]|eukprot:XP_004256224.1 hypothetical protein EIN_390780 [Entamoeba invadens IP1]